MIPTSFEQENNILDKPVDMTYEECEPLNVYAGELQVIGEDKPCDVIISCWKISAEELVEINKTGRVYLIIYSKNIHPPVAICGISPWKK